MALWQQYHQPLTVEAALAALAQHSGQARVVSGGTDLLLEMQQGHKPPVAALVDVTAVPALNQMVTQDGWIEIGAAVPHSRIVKSALVNQHATCLVESCGVIGGPQVRNVGTLGGNVAHALPAADGTTALVALNAEAEVASAHGREWRPILTLFAGAGRSTVDQTRELITRFRFAAAAAGSGSAFKRIMRPQGVALPILACAVWLKLGDAGKIVDARICIGPMRAVPCRAEQAEAVLRGRSLADALADCVTAAQIEFSPRSSKYRATASYRIEMIEVLLQRTLPLAWHRAATGEIIPEGVGL
jgi:CO/xanthine dehydrogenase FAD-binding subunit